MNRFLALLLMVGIICCGAASASDSAQDFPIGFDDFSRSLSTLEVTSTTPDYTSISLASPQIRVEDAVIDFETYQQFDLPGEPTYYQEGCPTVPHVTRYYRIPNTGSVDLVILAASYSIREDVNALPIQPEQERFRSAPQKAADVYGVDMWYPPEVAVVGKPMIMRDFRVVPVTLFPVQVNTVTGQARIYDQLEVDLVPNDTPGENEIHRVRPISRAYASMYSDMIANLDESALDEIDPKPGQILMICKDNATALQWTDTLATWKRRKGFDVAIETDANWTAAEVRSTIEDYYDAPDSRLEFAIIIGDAQSGTSYYVPTGTSDMENGTFDFYYACIDGDDELGDIGVGRMSASNETQLQTIMKKVMYYEREPYMDDTGWFDRAFLYAGTGQSITSNHILMLWAKRQFINLTGIDDPTVLTHANSVNENDIDEQLSEGVSYFFWRGSVIGEMQNSAATCMESSTMLPIVLTITCGTGDYNAGESLTEAWLHGGSATQPKGGVCGIGTALSYTKVPSNNTMAGGLLYAITNQGLEYLGDALNSGKYQLQRAFPTQIDGLHFSRWNNLMGDPTLSMWTDEPVVMNCSHTGTLNVGARRVTVQALNDANQEPIADALVVLWKGDESYTRGLTDAGGFVDMPVEIDTPGDLWVTVTKRNHKPYLATIACVNASQMTTYFSHIVDDDNSGGTDGNGDGLINPSETIDLNITLKNHGTTETADILNVTMTSDNPKVDVVMGTSTYPDIAPGQTAVGSNAFRISIDPSMRHLESAKLSIAVETASGTTYSTVAIECQAGDAIFFSSLISGGDGDVLLEPDENANLRVTILNNGGMLMNNVTGRLVSRSSQLSVVTEDATFGEIPIDGQASNSGSLFEVRGNAAAYPGTIANLLLILTYGEGSIDSAAFTLQIGVAGPTDPTGPDAYGYFAYDDVDLDYDDEPFEWLYPYDWLDISPTGVGTRLTTCSSDPGEQVPPHNANNTYTEVVDLPFPFTFYGVEYDQISICSNGWAAFGDQGELDMFRNYPIPCSQAPDAMLAPFWDDLQTSGGQTMGVWMYNDVDNDRFIIQWHGKVLESSFTQKFQVLLLNPEAYPTDDDNGIVVYQYNAVQPAIGSSWPPDIEYETIGIQAPGSLVGLMYRFRNQGMSGASSFVNHRTITITTEANVASGSVGGNVLDSETNEPLSGVEISIDGEGRIAITDVNGSYWVEDVLIGTYTLRASLEGYNDATVADFVVEQDSVETADFSMLHPEIELSTDHIEVVLPGSPPEASFTITNDGNGPLDYQVAVTLSYEGEEILPWESVSGIDVTELTSDIQIQGCEFIGDSWFVSGTSGGSQRKVYKFDLNGNLFGSFNQPWSPSDFGWQDLATDGTYLYGSGGPDITGVSVNGTVISTISGISNINPKSALAYDPATDHFWVADYTTDVYEIDRSGEVYSQFETNLNMKGLAWYPNDPDGYKLYIYHRNSSHVGTHISRMHPTSGDIDYVAELESGLNERAGGCTITPHWNSAMQAFAGIVQGPTGDRLDIRQVKFDTDWFSVSPTIATVNAGSTRDVSIFFTPDGLRDDSYDLILHVNNNSSESTVLLPVRLTTLLDAPDAPVVEPFEYALSQNYPNPFNGTTSFDFELKQAGPVSLVIYNLLGQQVAKVIDDVRDAGHHHVSFDMNSVASGVYLYRLESGDFSAVKKLVLLK